MSKMYLPKDVARDWLNAGSKSQQLFQLDNWSTGLSSDERLNYYNIRAIISSAAHLNMLYLTSDMDMATSSCYRQLLHIIDDTAEYSLRAYTGREAYEWLKARDIDFDMICDWNDEPEPLINWITRIIGIICEVTVDLMSLPGDLPEEVFSNFDMLRKLQELKIELKMEEL
jgi:hypothetical protein